MQKAQEIDTSNVFGSPKSTVAVSGVGFSHKHLAAKSLVETATETVEPIASKVSVVETSGTETTDGETSPKETGTVVSPNGEIVPETKETIEPKVQETVEPGISDEIQHTNNVTLGGATSEEK